MLDKLIFFIENEKKTVFVNSNHKNNCNNIFNKIHVKHKTFYIKRKTNICKAIYKMSKCVILWLALQKDVTSYFLECINDTIIWVGIISRKISYYMCDSACRRSVNKIAKIFWSYIKQFWKLQQVRNCRILISLWTQ